MSHEDGAQVLVISQTAWKGLWGGLPLNSWVGGPPGIGSLEWHAIYKLWIRPQSKRYGPRLRPLEGGVLAMGLRVLRTRYSRTRPECSL